MTTGTGSDDSIRPFRIDIPQADVDDLRNRLAHTRWAQDLPGTGWTRGVPTTYLQELADYWGTGFDWRKAEAGLHAYPQFTTTIDGQSIHFLHVRSPEPEAMPLVVTHGYPSSVAEFLQVIGPLTDPRSHGGDPADAFHVVAPSLPGYGFSMPLSDTDWEVGRTAKAWAELMHRLGYERYFAHGGDIGGGVSGDIGKYDPDGAVAAHVNTDETALALIGGMLPDDLDDLTEEQQAHVDRLRAYEADGRGYLQIQSTRPQTLAAGLTDSPAGQLAWIVEKFKEWTDLGDDTGLPNGSIDLDQLLTTISIYWFTRTGATASAFIYAASHGERDWSPAPTPTGFAAFGTTDGLLKRVLNSGGWIQHFSEFDRGGHFPAMEAPDLLVGDIRSYFRGFR
jgi:pimeloyl-ACP methyl ester carboxylesterase